MMGLAVIALVVWACLRNQLHSQSTARSPDASSRIAQISLKVTITPGKPGAPSETVEVSRRGTTPLLHVSRTDTFGNISEEESAEITLGELSDITKIVEREKLQSFEPQEKPGEILDFGVFVLRIELKSEEDTSPQVHEVSWQRPLKNQKRISPLMAQLSRIIHKRTQRVRLYYFLQRPGTF